MSTVWSTHPSSSIRAWRKHSGASNTVVASLVQMAWIRYLHRVPANQAIIGPDSDLATFLFGSERNTLTALREPLRDLQSA